MLFEITPDFLTSNWQQVIVMNKTINVSDRPNKYYKNYFLIIKCC